MASRRFGSVIPIGRAEYTREVTDASKEPEPDEDEKDPSEEVLKGTPVICFLYQEGNEPANVRLASQLSTIATKYPRTKIVSIVGNKCIENYPDRHLPSLFLYRNGSLRRQFIAYGKDRERPVEDLEVLLIATNMIDPHKALPVDPAGKENNTSHSEDESGDEEDRPPFGSKLGANKNIRSAGSKNVRSKSIRTGTVGREDEDDSDFDI
ncbi:uncharacterized protein EI90DRAFT_3028438 [Cantharellus anzutake]|uniref:uncharacterized protein n=1 Tax=Cantharellus anzutake TaxID=1750568 RepID=UPI001903B185|nr:uncharacterized protein EI90DRAFT_3028438 [Cantharellus anzutake]KAF8344147.1 hypothetical protein EI90DRAFT_3028438 [Cantharellus anzutake]